MWKKWVVVVDDDPYCLSLLVDMLNYGGYVAVPMASAEVALRYIQEYPPDAVICDMLFDGRPAGMQLITALRRNRETQHIPVMICSAAQELTSRLLPTLQSMQVHVLLKPFELDSFSALLEEIMLV